MNNKGDNCISYFLLVISVSCLVFIISSFSGARAVIIKNKTDKAIEVTQQEHEITEGDNALFSFFSQAYQTAIDSLTSSSNSHVILPNETLDVEFRSYKKSHVNKISGKFTGIFVNTVSCRVTSSSDEVIFDYTYKNLKKGIDNPLAYMLISQSPPPTVAYYKKHQ